MTTFPIWSLALAGTIFMTISVIKFKRMEKGADMIMSVTFFTLATLAWFAAIFIYGNQQNAQFLIPELTPQVIDLDEAGIP